MRKVAFPHAFPHGLRIFSPAGKDDFFCCSLAFELRIPYFQIHIVMRGRLRGNKGTALGHLKTTDLSTGMVLATDLYSRQGRLLLPAGSPIEGKHLRIFKIWGVESVDILGEESQDSAPPSLLEIDPQAFQQADAFLGPWFQNAGLEHEPMQEVYRFCLQRTAEQCAMFGVPPVCRTGLPAPGEGPVTMPRHLKPTSLEQLLRHEASLPAFPDIYQRVVEVLLSPNSSARHVAAVVSSDTALAARLLRLVNSPLYGFPSEVDSIPRAVALVGGNELCTLVLGISALSAFKDVPQEVFDMRAFWNHATACAVLARLLAGYKTGLSVERFFVAGLLHDVGLLFMLLAEPQLVARAMTLAAVRGRCLDEVERELMGFDHGTVGGELLQKWSFPESLTHAVRHHHLPADAVPTLEPAIVHVAESLATACSLCEGDCTHVPALDSTAFRALDLSPGVLGAVLEQAREPIRELRAVIVS